MSRIDSLQHLRRRLVQRLMRLILRPAKFVERGTLPTTGIYRILVCRFVQTLGDSLTLTPLLQELATLYPGAEIDVVSRCPAANLIFGELPGVSRIFRLPRHVARNPLQSMSVLRSIRRIRYDLVIDPDPQSQGGRLLAVLAHAERSLGYAGRAKAGSMTYNIVPPDDLRHRALLPVYLLRKALGGDPAASKYPALHIGLNPLERRQGRVALLRLLAARGDRTEKMGCVGIFANATGDKRLEHEWWVRFLAVFEAAIPNCQIVEILPAGAYSLLDNRYPGYYSRDARKLASLLSNLKLFISADCGVMHLSVAAGTSTVGLFTVTAPDEWGPYGAAQYAIMVRDHTPEETAVAVLEALSADAPARLKQACNR